LFASLLFALASTLVVFEEPGFPVCDLPGPWPEIPGARVTRSVAELSMALEGADGVLVWRHGSAFPAELWPSFVQFLENGGSFLYLGGEPFTRPVVGEPGDRIVQPRTVSLLKELRLNQCYRIDVGGHVLTHEATPGKALPSRPLEPGTWASILEPRLSDTRDSDHEDGAPGARDALVRPLSFVRSEEASPFPAASGAFAIDRLRGRYAGGRWVFHLVSTPPTPDELARLLEETRRPPVDVRVDPTLGCFHEGERPSVLIRAYCPREEGVGEWPVRLEVRGPVPVSGAADGPPVRFEATLRRGRHAVGQVALPLEEKPGLYVVTARCEGVVATTGFWILDEELFASGDELSFDGHTLLRNGRPEPVIGTTTMSSTVHRKFLFEPDAAAWDATFRELASLDINLVRTGAWSAYRKISLDPHVVDEAWLRALEAYYLTARRHGIPVLFTFFAFVPESFGGVSPYFDPRSLEGQEAYLTAVAERFSSAREMLWDLINEPSFASPEKLWSCRPCGDAFEAAAFREWLRERYGAVGEGSRSWEDEVRSRWRLLPDESIGPPTDDDYAERHVMQKHRPYRAREYSHFAQDAFGVWIDRMTAALGTAGSEAAITVGQDEGGLLERPNPLFHHHQVDFTSIHTWWANDHLVWDGLLAKARGKPLLVSETGIMQRELLSGEALRNPETAARLLSRKIGSAFASGAFGLVQWCYEVNPFMASDNEVAIGLKRVDGSYKPEHAVLRRFAAFVARNRQRFEQYEEPDVVLVWPNADHYSPRPLAVEATRRAVEILVEELGIPVQVVPEYRAHEIKGARLIVLPACRGISDGAWEAILSRIDEGATLLCSGWFETDDAQRPAVRLRARQRPLARWEEIPAAGTGPPSFLEYPLPIYESWCAAEEGTPPGGLARGKGRIHHAAVPLEWAFKSPAQLRFYEESLESAGVVPDASILDRSPGLLVRVLRFRDGRLVVAINESSRRGSFSLLDRPVPVSVPAGSCWMGFLDREGRLVDRSHQDEG
jgi:hypothetical protein